MEIAILVAAVAFFPGVAGYAWAIGWLPVYSAVCHFNKVFGHEINPDGYRIYLLDRGCDVDAAIRNVLAGSRFAAGPDKVDADGIVDIYHRRRPAARGDELLALDLVQKKFKEFATSTAGANSCTADSKYCVPEASDENFISRWTDAYLSYVQSQFRYTAMDGADYIVSLLQMGLTARVIIALCYLTATVLVVGRFVSYVIRRCTVSRKKAKGGHE